MRYLSKLRWCCCLAFLSLSGLSSANMQQDCKESLLTKDQKKTVEALVNEAQDLLQKNGFIKARKELMSSKFCQKDLYIFIIDHEHHALMNCGRPDFVGKDLSVVPDARDSAEKIMKKAAEGGGWVSYIWKSPNTHSLRCKTSWVTPFIEDRHDQKQSYSVGAGIEH